MTVLSAILAFSSPSFATLTFSSLPVFALERAFRWKLEEPLDWTSKSLGGKNFCDFLSLDRQHKKIVGPLAQPKAVKFISVVLYLGDCRQY